MLRALDKTPSPPYLSYRNASRGSAVEQYEHLVDCLRSVDALFINSSRHAKRAGGSIVAPSYNEQVKHRRPSVKDPIAWLSVAIATLIALIPFWISLILYAFFGSGEGLQRFYSQVAVAMLQLGAIQLTTLYLLFRWLRDFWSGWD